MKRLPPEAIIAELGLSIIRDRLKIEVEFGKDAAKKFDEAVRKKFGARLKKFGVTL